MNDSVNNFGIWKADNTTASNATIGATTGVGSIAVSGSGSGITVMDALNNLYDTTTVKKVAEKPKTSERPKPKASEPPKPKFAPVIKHISYSEEPGNRNVTVVFDDGDVRVEKPADDDVFDLQVGVALAIAHKMYQTKNGFRREVNNVKEDVWEKKRKKKERKQKAKERDGEVDGENDI